MIKIDINVFRKDLKKYLEIPCQVTRYGRAIASVVPTTSVSTPVGESISTGTSVSKVSSIDIHRAKTFFYNGKKYLIDDNGNEKEIK